MSLVFFDTAGLLALWDADDQWHAKAESAFAELMQAKALATTTSFVLLECANAAARRPYRLAVERLRTRLEARGRLVFPSTDEWAHAWSAFRQGNVGQPGVVDHVSFVVMRRLGIRQAFTNDHHFREAGFETLF